MEDDWIQETEARYESMKSSLHSMRRDIDVLRQRLDETEEIGSVNPSSSDLQYDNPDQKSASPKIPAEKDTFQPYYQPDLLSNLGCVDDFIEQDEYMEIRIRSSNSPFHTSSKDEKLLDCEVEHHHVSTTKLGDDGFDRKTWKSPSDFNTLDPFDEDLMNREFRNIKCACNSDTHQHNSAMETDLDDLASDKSERANDSEGSLSPAVSPTFGNYTSTDEVKIQNIVIASDDTITIPLNRSKEVGKGEGEEYQIYDNAHSLTTIDEASEEIEDEWSSSDIDLSLHESDRPTKRHGSRGQSTLIKQSRLAKESQSIMSEFKSSPTKQVEDSGLASDMTNHSSLESSMSNERVQARNLPDSNQADSFVFNERHIMVKDPSPVVAEIIHLRPKHTDSKTNVNNPRPMSADAKKLLKQVEKPQSGSLHSINSIISQESVISEAESYVTVRSHIANTGSEEAYTTAYSDSDAPVSKSSAKTDYSDPDECPTLSRKRTKGTLNQRLLKKDTELSNFSGSDTEEEQEMNYAATPVPITVTPKFIKLPSRLCTSGDYNQDSNDDDNINSFHSGSSDPQKEFTVEPLKAKDNSFEIDCPSKTSGNNQHQQPHTPYKRFQFRRPNRQQLSDETTESPQSSDSESKPDDALSSSSSSSEEFEAYYDTSKPGLWKTNPNDQWSGIILPNLIHKPNIPLDNLNEPLDIRSKKRLSSIEETSSNSLVDAVGSDGDENNHSSSDRIPEAVVVVPKFSNLRQLPDVNSVGKHASSDPRDKTDLTNQITPMVQVTNPDNLNTHEPINDERALTQAKTLLVKNHKPVTPREDHNQDKQTISNKVRIQPDSNLSLTNSTTGTSTDLTSIQTISEHLSDQSSSSGQISGRDRCKVEQLGNKLESTEMPGLRSPFNQKQHYFPRRPTNPTPPTLLPKPNYPLPKQNGHNPLFPNQTKPPIPNSARSNSTIQPDSGPKNEVDCFGNSYYYSNAKQESGIESFSDMYDNEYHSYPTTFDKSYMKPSQNGQSLSMVEDESRPSTSSKYMQNLQSTQWSTCPDDYPFASRQFETVRASIESQDISHDIYSNAEVDDIKPASQRTSRIMQGAPEYLSTPLEISDLTPKLPEQTFIQMLDNKLPNPIKTHSIPPSDKRELNIPIKAEDMTNKMSLSFDAESELSQIHNKPQYSETNTQLGQVQLMQAPQITNPVKPETSNFESSPRRQRNSSPSPPRSTYRAYTGIVTSKPPSQIVNRTRWQLKSIPTDSEIRERLRSRSRQRADERQSRSTHVNEQSTYRPRNSRSDSRYRCTDLDSAIAESRADTLETSGPFVTESEPHSEARQSASLFDLDAHTQKTAQYLNHQKPASTSNQYDKPADNINKRLLGDAKSYNSLLETDIDTGENFERPLILETDLDKLDTKLNTDLFDAAVVDKYENKTRSLFNLTVAHTPASFRHQTAPGRGNANDADGMVQLVQSPTSTQYDWQRTKSYQGLSQRDPAPLAQNTNSLGSKHQSRFNSSGARGLIDRLKDKARSTHELRIAQSLTKLHIPEWLDKADCFENTTMTTSMTTGFDVSQYKPQFRQTELKPTSQSPLSTRSRPALTSFRSLSSVPRPSDLMAAGTLSSVETVAEPTWPKPANLNSTKFVRPSLALRQKADQGIKPISSKLYSSMRSLSSHRKPGDESKSGDIRPQVAPRANRSLGQGTVIELGPQDFVPRHEQLWGRESVNRVRENRAVTEPPRAAPTAGIVKLDKVEYGISTDPTYINYDPTKPDVNLISSPNQQIFETPQHPAIRSISDIKDADYDSGTEHSSERNALSLKKDINKGTSLETPILTQKVNGLNNIKTVSSPSNGTYPTQVPTDSQPWNVDLTESEVSVANDKETSPNEAEWAAADVDGESESEVTDGLDQISDLTCLTSLVDSCASRHRTLLANRPSALEHLLTGLGWWPDSPNAEHRYLPPTAAEAISIAAHEFDVKEDSHRIDYIRILTGPNSRRPINLGEFGLNQLSGMIQRRPEDGLLYMRCGRPECTTKPVRVDQVTNWCSCTNCFTLYCSPNCRAASERTMLDHPKHCSFARAKRVCSRILRNLSPDQLTGLTALAKTGMARLGRGGILLPFALVRHAEIFLQRSLSQTPIARETDSAILEQAAQKWEKFHQPSPGGLLAPPIYLTLNELEELDSTVIDPCRTYSPSNSMVLIVVICAYELIARSDGRPVHLFKQSLIVPFPSSHSNATTRQLPQTIESVTKSPNMIGTTSRSSQQSIAAREAYMIRLQRMLRERGVSLRHHHPEIYTQLANFVETGIPFAPMRITFHDFVMKEEVICTISPMSDLYIQPVRSLNTQMQQQHQSQSVIRQNQQTNDRRAQAPDMHSMKTPRTGEPISSPYQMHTYPETNF